MEFVGRLTEPFIFYLLFFTLRASIDIRHSVPPMDSTEHKQTERSMFNCWQSQYFTKTYLFMDYFLFVSVTSVLHELLVVRRLFLSYVFFFCIFLLSFLLSSCCPLIITRTFKRSEPLNEHSLLKLVC